MTTTPKHALSLWTVYERPRDYPDEFVARRFTVGPHLGGTCAGPTDDVLRAAHLAALRAQLLARGLVCIARHPEDDPCIVETWL